MPIKIAVCDDELQAIRQIDAYLSQIQKETGLEFQIFYFSSGEELLRDMPRDVKVLLLDIQMARVSGIEAARKLRDEGADFYLILITGNVQYALDGYSVHAYAFLCKPLQYAHLKSHLTEVISRISRAAPAVIEIKNGATSNIVDCRELVYAEVYGHTSIVVLDNGRRITGRIPLDELELKLSKHGFFRCHKSYLINLRKVRSIRPAEVVMSDDTVVALSRDRKQHFLIALHETVGE